MQKLQRFVSMLRAKHKVVAWRLNSPVISIAYHVRVHAAYGILFACRLSALQSHKQRH